MSTSFTDWRIAVAVFLIRRRTIVTTLEHRVVGPSLIHGRDCSDASILQRKAQLLKCLT
jgi:hypothetical protein